MKKLKYYCFVIFLSFLSCQAPEPTLGRKYNIVIRLSPWMTFNYNTQKLRLEFTNDVTVDSIEFSDEELQFIDESFVKNHIDTITGIQSYGEGRTFPAWDLFEFYIYKGSSKQAEILYYSESPLSPNDSPWILRFE